MELNGFDRKVAVANPHDDAIFSVGSNFQDIGKLAWDREERVIATDCDIRGEALKNAFTFVVNLRRLPVHGVRQDVKLTAEGLDDSLQTQAYTEHRDTGFRSMEHQRRDAKVRRAARTRRNQDKVGLNL